MEQVYFQEYEYKNRENRIRINYLRDSEERLNPWEITNFISRVTTYMYKIEMLNTIALAINQGVERKNIFVLDKAYKLNGNYKYFSTVNLDTLDLNKIYAIGMPHSMEPNQDLAEIKFLFEILYKLNQVLYQYGKRRINKWDRLDAYQIMRREDFLSVIDYLSEKTKCKLDDQDYLKAGKKIETECTKIKKKYNAYLSDQLFFERVTAKLENKNVEAMTDTEREIEENYFKKFYEYLFILPRPVVGIYYKSSNEMQILCADHFDCSVNHNTKIDLKSITQNSPIMAEIEAGCEILALKKEEERKKELHALEKRKAELEIAKKEKENALLDQEAVKNELDILNKTIELKTRLDAMAATEENKGLKRVCTSYAKQQLSSVYHKVQNGYDEVLHTNHFNEHTNTIIDMRV